MPGPTPLSPSVSYAAGVVSARSARGAPTAAREAGKSIAASLAARSPRETALSRGRSSAVAGAQHPQTGLAETNAVRRPVDEEDLADQVLARHGAPRPRVAGLVSVVTHEEVVSGRHVPGAAHVVAPLRLDVRLDEQL